ncbi:MAG: hypothetical protein IK127_01755 [Clostridia bacterium]|nr:hypothetical protein [Clostridia bacterium]
MKLSLVAVGSAGAQVAEALLHCAFSGALTREDVIRVNLLCAPPEQAERLRGLYAAYSELRGGWGLAPHTSLAPILSLRTQEMTGTLGALTETTADTDLLRCVIPANEAVVPAMTASHRAASVAWACALAAPEGALAELLADAETMPTILCASLAETCGAAAVEQLGAKLTGKTWGALLLSTLWQGEDEAAVHRFLESSGLQPAFLALAGLPDDCALPPEGPHLTHLLLVRALEAFAGGVRGEYGFRVPLALDWHALDPNGPQWGASFDRLLRFDALWQSVFAPEATRLIGEGTVPRGRMPAWASAYIARRIPDGAPREEALRQIGRVSDLAHAGACWLRGMQSSLPFLLRPSVLLNDAREKADTHYEQLLKRAGQLALLDHDIRQAGMTSHTTIHRHDMEDTDDETALLQREAVREALQLDAADQAELDARLGGRIRLNSLRDIAAREREEADRLRQEAAEARRVIDRAAASAKPDDLPKVDQARSRLRRMERRLASLEGRASQAAADVQAASAPEKRTRPPLIETELDSPPEVFWPAAWLDMLCGLPAMDPRTRGKQAQSVLTYWPWTDFPARQAVDRIARLEAPEAAPILRLMDVVLYVSQRDI